MTKEVDPCGIQDPQIRREIGSERKGGDGLSLFFPLALLSSKRLLDLKNKAGDRYEKEKDRSRDSDPPMNRSGIHLNPVFLSGRSRCAHVCSLNIGQRSLLKMRRERKAAAANIR